MCWPAGGPAEREGRALRLPGEAQRLRLPAVSAQPRGAHAGGSARLGSVRPGPARIGSALRGAHRPSPADPRHGEGAQEGIVVPERREEELAAAEHGGRRAGG